VPTFRNQEKGQIARITNTLYFFLITNSNTNMCEELFFRKFIKFVYCTIACTFSISNICFSIKSMKPKKTAGIIRRRQCGVHYSNEPRIMLKVNVSDDERTCGFETVYGEKYLYKINTFIQFKVECKKTV